MSAAPADTAPELTGMWKIERASRRLGGGKAEKYAHGHAANTCCNDRLLDDCIWMQWDVPFVPKDPVHLVVECKLVLNTIVHSLKLHRCWKHYMPLTVLFTSDSFRKTLYDSDL